MWRQKRGTKNTNTQTNIAKTPRSCPTDTVMQCCTSICLSIVSLWKYIYIYLSLSLPDFAPASNKWSHPKTKMVSAKCRLERSGLLIWGLCHAVSIFCVNYFPIMLFKNMRKKNSNDVREVRIPTVVQYLAGCRYLMLPAVIADSDKKQHIPAQLLSSDKIITGSGMHTWLEDKENKKKVKPFVLKALIHTNHQSSPIPSANCYFSARTWIANTWNFELKHVIKTWNTQISSKR